MHVGVAAQRRHVIVRRAGPICVSECLRISIVRGFRCERDENVVHRETRLLHIIEAGMHGFGQRIRTRQWMHRVERLEPGRMIGEALEPDRVGDQQMVERAAYRAEESTPVRVQFLFLKTRRGRLDLGVHPVVVGGHPFEMVLESHDISGSIGPVFDAMTAKGMSADDGTR